MNKLITIKPVKPPIIKNINPLEIKVRISDENICNCNCEDGVACNYNYKKDIFCV